MTSKCSRVTMAAMLCFASVLTADYCPPSSPQSDGMRDIMLIYGGPGKWTKEDFRPYAAYLDRDGKPRDWFYDAYLFMMFGGAPSGKTYISEETNKADWEFFIAEEFAADREIAALDAAIEGLAKELRAPAPTFPVIVMIPYPSRKQKDFGDVDGDGKTEDLSADDARQKVVAWFLRSFLERWKQQRYRHLKLWGFYWMNEGIGPNDEAVVRAAAGEIHALGCKFHWIPWFNAPGVEKWRELGFDLVVMQPNFAFIHPAGGLRIPDENRLTVAANQCRRLGMGIEMELNEGLFKDPAYRVNLQLYLDHGDESLDGYQAGAVRAYYQGHDTIARLCRNKDASLRRLYDDLYQFHKGDYKRRRPYQPLEESTPALKCLADGRWKTRPDARADSVEVKGPHVSLTFDLGATRLVGDVRVHFAASDKTPLSALQRLGLALSAEATGEAFEEVAEIADVNMRLEDGGGFGILTFPLRPARRMRMTFDIQNGRNVHLDEVLLMPASHLLWGCPYGTDPETQDESSCLTDGVSGSGAMAVWPGGAGHVRLDLPECWFADSLVVYFRRASSNAFAPSVNGRISPNEYRASCQITDPANPARIPIDRPVEGLILNVEDRTAGVVAADEVALLPARNLALGCAYTLDPPFPAKYPDTGGYELTDGQLTERGFGDGKTVGWASWEGAPVVTVVVDVGQVRPIDSVEAHVEGGGYAGVEFPALTTAAVSDDGRRWRQIAASDAPPQFVQSRKVDASLCALAWMKLPAGAAQGRFVKVRFISKGWLMLSEVRVMSREENVALGRPYTLSPQPTGDGQYPDNSGKLTDGFYSKPGVGWKACAGFDKADPSITVDLGASQRVHVARLHFVGGGPAGVYFPKEMSVSTSEDGKTWTPAGVTQDHPPEDGKAPAVGFMGVRLNPREARFVRFHVKRHGWAMPDEMEVY